MHKDEIKLFLSLYAGTLNGEGLLEFYNQNQSKIDMNHQMHIYL